MNSARMSPGQDPDEFLYELDTRRERLNACDPSEGSMDRQFENIILEALLPENERIRTSHLEKPDFGIANIHEFRSSVPTTTSKQGKGTWPFGPSPATCPWPFAEREKTVIDCGRKSKHDLTYMFDTDGEGGPLYGTGLNAITSARHLQERQ